MKKENKERIKNIILMWGIIILVIAIMCILFKPVIDCQAEGNEWDNITVKCVPKGQTTWNRWFPTEENKCKECCDCIKTCKETGTT